MNRIHLKIISLALAGFLVLALGGCSVFSLTEEEKSELEEDDATVVVGQSVGEELAATYAADDVFSLNSVPDASFNPYQTTSAWNQVVGMLAYETLVTTDGDFAVTPNLITDWSTEDGISWVFHVDTSRGFHDGGVMTAADAVYSIEQAMSYGGKYERRFSSVIGISTLDTESFAVTLDAANYRFYALLNIPCIEYGTAYEDMPAGTGPYKFSEDGKSLVLDENHPKASEMPLDTIYLKEYTATEDILQAFEDSYIDLVFNNPTGMSSLGYSSTNIKKYVDTTCLHYLGYNMSSRLFGQIVYRAMMTYAIDRDTIVSDCMQGAAVAAALPIHPNSSLYPTEYAKTISFSETTLTAALQNAGAEDVNGDGQLEFGGEQITINFIVCSDSSAKVSAARIIAAQMESAGLTVNLRELGYDDFVQNLEDGNFDIYYGEVKLCGDWDLSVLLDADGELNYGGVRDDYLTAYMQAFLASSEETLPANSEQLYQYIGQSAPITAICFEKSQVLYHRGVLSGLDPTQDNLFNGMENWTIELG